MVFAHANWSSVSFYRYGIQIEKVVLINVDYVTSWCKTNEFDKPAEQQLNDAIKERMSYARKQLLPKQRKNKTAATDKLHDRACLKAVHNFLFMLTATCRTYS